MTSSSNGSAERSAQGNVRDLLGFLRSKEPEMVSLLEQFTNMDSPSTSKEHTDRFASAVAEEWRYLGADVTVLPQEVRGNHVRAEWGKGEDQILLLCHMDTVWNPGEAARRPFRIEGSKGFGPGAFDMKAGIVQGLFAVQALAELGLTPNHRLVILHNSDEEIGSPSSRPIIEEEAKKSRAVLVLEPSTGGALKTWRKGVGGFRVTIQGKSAHAGADYEKGVSAVVEAAHQILYLSGLTDLDEGTTVNVGVVQAGSRTNVIAEQAVLSVDLRVKTLEAGARIAPKIANLKPVDPRVSVSVTGGINRPPMERNHDTLALFQLARSVAAEIGIDLEESGTGGGSDGNFTSALGIPTLDGLGGVGDNAHSLDEWVLLPTMPQRSALLAGLLLRL